MQKKSLLFIPDPPDEGGGTPTTETPPASVPVPTPAGNPPPAATAVVNGKTENEINLERELAEERNKRQKAETDAASLSEENRQLKQSTEPKDKKGNGWVFPDEE